MTVEHLIECPDCGDMHSDEVQSLNICDTHESILRALLIQRGFGADLDMSHEDRLAMYEQGRFDTKTEVTNHLIMGVMAMFGGAAFMQYNGCPVCVLEGTLERAVDEVAANRRKSN